MRSSVPTGGPRTAAASRVVGPSPAVRRVFEITGVSELLLIEPQPLTWRQVTFHTSGWRQWMTVETTEEGRPVAEIVEVGPENDFAGDGVHYALETSGATTQCGSLDEAMRAAERLGFVASQTSQRRDALESVPVLPLDAANPPGPLRQTSTPRSGGHPMGDSRALAGGGASDVAGHAAEDHVVEGGDGPPVEVPDQAVRLKNGALDGGAIANLSAT